MSNLACLRLVFQRYNEDQFRRQSSSQEVRINGLLRALGSVGLRDKIAGMVAAVVLGLGLTSSIVVRTNLTRVLESRLTAHASSVARAVAAHHEDSLRLPNALPSHSLIESMVETDPEGLYAIVQESGGAVLVRAARPEAPAERLGPVPGPADEAPQVKAIETSAGRVYEASTPIAGTGLVARVGLSTRAMNAEIAATTRNLAAVVGVALVLAVSVSLLLAQVLTRPILALQRAVRDTSLGHLPEGVKTGWHDEIGELNRAFNAMTAGLARSRDALVAQNRELAVLNATASAIGGSLRVEEILRAALGAILQEMGLQAGWIALREGRGDTARSEAGAPERPGASLAMVVASGLSERFAAEEAAPDWEACACLDVLASGRCKVIQDMNAECTRLSQETLRLEGLITHACVPLVARDEVVGVLNVAADSRRRFPEAELQLLCSIGRQIGVAVDNSQLWDQVQRKDQLRGQLLERTLLAQEDERRRIALELHDQLGSSLASLSVGLRMLRDSVAVSQASQQQFRALHKQLATIAQDVHQLAFDLRPAALDRLGLVDAVEQTVHNFAREHGLAADFQAIGLDGERMPSEVETAVYRIIQEALTNVAKHARATEIGVLIERRFNSLVAVIEDNGRGFDPLEALTVEQGHLGLFGMQERAALVGGKWDVESAPGNGATVFVEVPAPPRAPEPRPDAAHPHSAG